MGEPLCQVKEVRRLEVSLTWNHCVLCAIPEMVKPERQKPAAVPGVSDRGADQLQRDLGPVS